MVDRRTISPRQLAKSMYVPEENQGYQDLREDPEYRQKLIDAALQASMVIPVGGAIAGSAQAAKAVPGMVGRASEYARGLETAAGGISPVEMAIKQSKYPGRFLHPETGAAQSISGGVLSGRSEPAMGAVHNAFESINPQIVNYLTRPRPVVNPETGYQLQQIMPGNKFGPGIAEFTMGQRAARTGVAAVPYLAAGSLAPYLAPNAMPSAESARSGEMQGPSEMQGPPEMQGPAQFQAGAGRGFMLPNADERAAYEAQQAKQDAIATARARTAPMPPARPADLPREQPGILSRIFSGGDYQSKGGELRQDGRINWGDPELAADFFRASKARQETPEASGMKRGGAAGKPDSMHKALEIIHHLLTRSH